MVKNAKGAPGAWRRRLWLVVLVVFGGAAVFFAPHMKKPPQKTGVDERAVKVRVIRAPKVTVLAKVVGYGTVMPGRTWEAVTEIPGLVVWKSDVLKSGRFIKAGTEILRIDDSSYKLALAQIDAQLEASLVKDRTTRASLKIKDRDFRLLKTDLERKKALATKGTISKSALEAVERQVLNGAGEIQTLKNALAINAAERGVLTAQRASAEFDLRRASFKAPFDVRVLDVKTNESQYASRGQTLFTADGIAIAEVEAQFPIGRLRPIAGGARSKKQGPSAEEATDWVPGVLGLDAVVRLRSGERSKEWKGKVVRVAGAVDSQTQSLGVVVVVDDPYGKAKPGRNPPLVRNMFVDVELRGKPIPNQIIVPLSALHEGKIYVVGDDNRLDIRPAALRFTQGDFASLAKGLKPGESVVVSDPIPAVEGMLLNPTEDKKAKKRLVVAATGKVPGKGPGKAGRK